MKSIVKNNIYIFFIVGLIFMVGCNFSHTNDDDRQDIQKTVATDSLSLLEQIISSQDIAQDYKKKIIYIEKLDSLAGTMQEPEEKAMAWLKAGQFYRNVSCYELAEKALLKAQRETEAMKEEYGMKIKVDILLARGQNCVDMSDFVNATQLLTEAGNYFTDKKDYVKLSKVYMAHVIAYQVQYVSMPPDKKAEMQERENYYLDKLGKLYFEIEDPISKIDCLNALVNYAINEKDYEKANVYLSRLDSLSRSCNYTEGLISYYGNSGFVAEKQGNLKEGMALQYKAYETALGAGNMAKAAQALANAAFDAIRLNEYELTRCYSLIGVELAKEYDIKSQLWRFLDNLSNLEEAKGNFKQALDYRNECVSVYIELYSEINSNQINQYAARFESLQKEKRINELQSETEVFHYKSRQKSQLIFFLTLTVILSVIIFTIVIFYRQNLAKKREQIALHRIKQLEQEKQLVATQAVLDGETRERARLARDLHDGLGSMLTGARLNLLEMKKGAILEYAGLESFDNVLGLIDRSVQEMRRVAHHLMPDSLSRYGLKLAVNDFCNAIPSVTFSYFGNEARLDSKMEVMIYRVIHELVNNALKHSGADRIMVQIMQEPNRIAFTIQDNGCGFDHDAVVTGMGLHNIRNRVASYNGIFDIDSKIGVGTEINVELKI